MRVSTGVSKPAPAATAYGIPEPLHPALSRARDFQVNEQSDAVRTRCQRDAYASVHANVRLGTLRADLPTSAAHDAEEVLLTTLRGCLVLIIGIETRTSLGEAKNTTSGAHVP
jgi:hypothetical protein